MKARKASQRERLPGTGILAILLITVLWVWMQQAAINPAVVAMRPDIRTAAESATPSADLLATLPPGLTVMTPAERFDADNLYEKINGQAELYLSSGFVGLTSQRLVSTENPELWLEVFVYDMGSDRNAFAVYSRQRRDTSQPVPGLSLAYRTPNALFVSYGALYIEIVAAVSSEQADAAMQAIAASLTQAAPQPGNALIGMDWFPPDGRDPNSLTIISANAFGFEKLNQVTTVTYSLNDAEVTAFVSQRPTQAAAQHLADEFKAFLLAYGGRLLEAEPGLPAAYSIEIMDTYDIIFTVGPYLAGVHEAWDRATAVELAQRLQKSLKEAAGG